MFKVGITGGIGSGKSTLSRMFGELGIPVYDSDRNAKELMANNRELREAIIEAFGAESYLDGVLNRPYLAQVVFNDKAKLAKLNSLVHPSVRADFAAWCDRQDAPYVILECAILFDSNFHESVDRIICVLSPKPMRIERVTSRDGLTAKQVEERINNQMSDDEIHARADYSVVNFELEDLEDAAKIYNKQFIYEAGQN